MKNNVLDDLISRQATIDVLALGKEILNRVLDDVDVIGQDREKYSWGLGLIKSYINDISELPSTQPEIIRCKECKHFHYNMPYVIQGIPVLGHEVCDFWGDGCKTNENGFCSYAERREE